MEPSGGEPATLRLQSSIQKEVIEPAIPDCTVAPRHNGVVMAPLIYPTWLRQRMLPSHGSSRN
ncbi:hypothetical protein E2562_020420 [Oryza meyeriana var. granulata]|uniref:Uncharacterized protein n=1 Tax=Oryza meyeriana var. granulata TaxID=110450 RepID=A0A6G1D5Q3_9ORYZ|nr:hypothetical protein E2562_020420 [Oryza meyeriana var. granulata]